MGEFYDALPKKDQDVVARFLRGRRSEEEQHVMIDISDPGSAKRVAAIQAAIDEMRAEGAHPEVDD